ncbi:MAG: hypothetical protein KJ886_02665, partial [Candidatus Thermoplasmatota archaeon]|nr:hypothetical protein [Candidatus Thermoplasmatota archaeon]
KAIRTIEDCVDRQPYSDIIKVLKAHRTMGFKEIREYFQNLNRPLTKDKKPYKPRYITVRTDDGSITETEREGIKIAPSTLFEAIARLAKIGIIEKTSKIGNGKYKISKKTQRRWMFASITKSLETTSDDEFSILDMGIGDGSLLITMRYKDKELNPEEKKVYDEGINLIGKGMKKIKKVVDNKRDKRIVHLIAKINPHFEEG